MTSSNDQNSKVTEPTESNSNSTDFYFALLLAGLVAISPFSIDVYLPAIPTIADDLATNIHRVELSLGLFLIGLAFGQLVGGPISDARGRRVVCLSGLFVFVIASVCCVLSEVIGQLLSFRFIQGLGAGFASVVAMAAVRDRYEGAVAAKMFALIGVIMMLAPLFAPVVGSVLLNSLGWRSIFWALAIYSVFIAIMMFKFLPEGERASCPEIESSDERGLQQGFWKKIANQYAEVFAQKQALGYLFFQAFSFSSMFAFLTESPFVYMEFYGISDKTYPIVFGLNIIVMIIFNRITAYRLSFNEPRDLLKIGVAVQLCCNTALFALALYGYPPFLLLLTFIMLSVGTQGLIVANTMSCYMACFSKNAGAANGVLGITQFLIGALIGWITTLLHNGSLLPMTGMMLASTLLGLSLLYYFSFRKPVS